ncbi:MAG: J domain-containing protein [Deltaproteobacteria bacterium]|nr:J domain-containing protein [Deltaproteobacteria bacterium]MBN2672304.1 J domain-containing protein [Deltaproteobacteria bacterium]
MPNRDPAFDDYVIKIHNVLTKLDYYRLLGVQKDAGKADVKRAFLKITAKFHPDRHRDATPQIHEAIYDIFKRLNEAYRVLTDPEKRKLYDQQLSAGNVRFSTDLRMSMVPKTPEETITNRDARQFYVKSRECLTNGNIMQAELHAKMAKAREPNNEAVNALLSEIQEAKKKR